MNSSPKSLSKPLYVFSIWQLFTLVLGVLGKVEAVIQVSKIPKSGHHTQCPKLGKFLTGHSQILYQNLVNCDWLQCIFEDFWQVFGCPSQF